MTARASACAASGVATKRARRLCCSVRASLRYRGARTPCCPRQPLVCDAAILQARQPVCTTVLLSTCGRRHLRRATPGPCQVLLPPYCATNDPRRRSHGRGGRRGHRCRGGGIPGAARLRLRDVPVHLQVVWWRQGVGPCGPPTHASRVEPCPAVRVLQLLRHQRRVVRRFLCVRHAQIQGGEAGTPRRCVPSLV